MGNRNRNRNKTKPTTNDKTNMVIKSEVICEEKFKGPLPPPQIMAGYKEVIPDAPERIMKIFESQSAHRQEIENKVIDSKLADSRRGMIFGFVLALILIIGSFILLWAGKKIEGFSILLGTATGLIATFVYATRSNKKEREKKQKELDDN